MESPYRRPPTFSALGRALEARWRALPLGMLLLAIVSVPVLVLQPEGLPRMRALRGDLDIVNRQNIELRRDIGRLRVEVKELRDNPAAVERIARDQLGLVRRSEAVFQFRPTR